MDAVNGKAAKFGAERGADIGRAFPKHPVADFGQGIFRENAKVAMGRVRAFGLIGILGKQLVKNPALVWPQFNQDNDIRIQPYDLGFDLFDLVIVEQVL